MKKLNESVLRKLIIETIESDLVIEGRKKKKIKEVTPVSQGQEEDPLGQDPGRTDVGTRNRDFDYSDEEVAKMSAGSPSNESLDEIIEGALQVANNKKLPPTVQKATLESVIKQITDLAKQKLGLNNKEN